VSPSLSYAAVTPARDEAHNLPRLAASLIAQTVKPLAWVIVDNGSSDGTMSIARRLAAEHDWIHVRQTPPGSRYDRSSPLKRAFHSGVDALEGKGDIVAKFDADVSMDPEFMEGVLTAFQAEPTLGMASGTLLEERDGRWRELILLGDHCWGPTRCYRRQCLAAVLPLDDGGGFASIDETKAHVAGFRTRTLRHLPFRHHRLEGTGEGSRWKAWRGQGEAAHYTGYRFSYLLARCAYRVLSDRAALGLIVGYFDAALHRRPRYHDPQVRAALRERQRIRHFFAVIRGRIGEEIPADLGSGYPDRAHASTGA
jgi:poly-beta-1,6-N-acetyl-D-glucosamine synthase